MWSVEEIFRISWIHVCKIDGSIRSILNMTLSSLPLTERGSGVMRGADYMGKLPVFDS